MDNGIDTRQASVTALTCALSPSPAESSSSLVARQILEGFSAIGIHGEETRVDGLFQAPDDGYPIPGKGCTCGNAEGTQTSDHTDPEQPPEAAASATRTPRWRTPRTWRGR